MAQILKPRHTLLGKSIIPVISQVKNADSTTEFARLKKEHPLESYSMQELHSEFEKLTGEPIKSVLLLLGDISDELLTARLLLHFSILQANLVGGPRGQMLSDAGPSSAIVDSSGKSKRTSQSVSLSDNAESDRISAIETTLSNLQSQKTESQVEESLRHIRILAGRPKLTLPHVLIAAIESLVETATRTRHKDVDFYIKSLSYCRKYENSDDFCHLVLKLFGSAEDKKISSAVTEWAKSRKYENDKSNDKGNDGVPVPQSQFGVFPNHFPQPFQYMPFSPYPYPPVYPFSPRGFSRGRSRGRRFAASRSNSSCFYCKESGHFVSSCPKLLAKESN